MRHKGNRGKAGVASNERAGRKRATGKLDFIAERAWYMTYRNSIAEFPRLPTLGIASHYRREAVARKLSGRPLLG